MRRLPPHLAPLGYSPRRYLPLSPAPVLGMAERLTDLRDIQQMFANGEQGGYWPADPAYAYEDSAGTTLASVNGVVGYRMDVALGKHAVQSTTANKPYLRRTPTTNKPWYDSNTATGAMTATFVSELGRRNLLTYSENFASLWNISHASVTPNAAIAPDGTMTAWKITEDSVNSLHLLQQNPSLIASTVYTKSIYAKAAERNWLALQLRTPDGIWRNANFNLSDGTIGSRSNVTATTVNVGNGWYRCSITATSPGIGVTSNNEAIFIASANETFSYQGNGTSGIYIWCAQLEVGTTPTEYQKIVAGPSAVLDPTALAATYPQNISAATNCTVACVTPEGVVIADNQTVGTTFNITPPYGYNSDVLIINRALTPAEKALVTRVMQRSVPQLGSELVTNGSFDTDTWWSKNTGASISGGVGVLTDVPGAQTAIYANNLLTVGIQYYAQVEVIGFTGILFFLAPPGGGCGLVNGLNKKAVTATSTHFGVGQYDLSRGNIDNVSVKAIL